MISTSPIIDLFSSKGWLELRKSLQEGLVLVDIEAPDFATLCRTVGDQLVTNQSVSSEVAEKLIELWQKKHRHQFEGPRKAEGKLTTVIKELLVQKLESKAERSGLQIPKLNDDGRRLSINDQEQNQNRRIPGTILLSKVGHLWVMTSVWVCLLSLSVLIFSPPM